MLFSKGGNVALGWVSEQVTRQPVAPPKQSRQQLLPVVWLEQICYIICIIVYTVSIYLYIYTVIYIYNVILMIIVKNNNNNNNNNTNAYKYTIVVTAYPE